MKRPYRVAVLAYPPAYRQAHGDELVATATELTAGRWSLRQARSLMLGGLGMRARLAGDYSAEGVVVAGARLGLFLFIVISMAAPLVWRLGLASNTTIDTPWPILLAPIVVAAILVFTSRWPAAVALTALSIVTVVRAVADSSVSMLHGQLAASGGFILATTALAWWIALRGDGRRATNPRSGLVVLAGSVLCSWLTGGSVFVFAVLALIVAGIVLAAVDPRPLVAGTTCWLIATASYVPRWGIAGPRSVVGIFLVGVAAVLATLSITSARRLNPNTP